MKTLYQSFCFIFTCLLLANCTPSHDPAADRNPANFVLNLKQKKSHHILFFNDFFSDEKIVPLLPKDSAKIAEITKVIFYDSKYFILDKKFSQLFSFDEHGLQIAKFGNVGFGPGEFKKISDFDIVGDQLAILSNDDQAINYYNVNTGKFIKRKLIQLFGYSLACLPGDSTLIFVNQNGNEKSKDHNVIALNASTNVTDRYFPIDAKKNYISITFSGFLNKSNGGIYYAPPFSDIVYRYADGEFQRYIDLGINSANVKANNDNLDKMFKETLIRDPQTSFLEELFFKNENYIATTFQDSMRSNFCFYDVKKKEANTINKNIVHDPNILLMNNPKLLTNKNEIFFDISPETVYYLKTSLPETYDQLSKENKQVLATVTKSSNPLLMICKIK